MFKFVGAIAAFVLGPLVWVAKKMASFEIINARPCEDDKMAERYKAHAVFYIPEDRTGAKRFKNPDADGQPQRMYMFFVNKPKVLLNPSDDVIEYIYDHFYRLGFEVRGISVRKPNGEWKYVPFYIA